MRAWPWRRIFLVSAIVLIVVGTVEPLRRAVSLAIGDVIVFVLTPFAPSVDGFAQLPGVTRLVAKDGSVIGDLGADGLQQRDPVALAALPDHVRDAVLAAEDKNFYSHGGLDTLAVARAALRTVAGNSQGGSTITQQLAKLNYTGSERTLFRKARELLYAAKLEKKYSKDELLERYLNQVYFGESAYGLASAARTFFATTPDKLTASQAAMLAGKIRAPESLDPRTQLRDVTRRRNQVLVNMKRNGWLDEAPYKAALAEPIVLAPAAISSAGRAPHFAAFIEREAKTLDALGASKQTRAAQLFTGGYTIETTLDPAVLDATVAAVQARLGAAGDPTTAAATVQPGDGAVRSLFGGLDFASTQFDMSSLAGRQAGSAFKPFVYMAALRNKIDPRSVFDGTSGRVIPCYGTKPVKNYAGEDAGGALTVDDALVHSVNVVFVDLGCHMSAGDVLRAATDDGIPDDAATAQGAIFLGGLDGTGVNALDMATAYATFAARGVYAKPYGIARILDRDKEVVYEHKADTKRVFSEDEVGVINNPLLRVVREGTGRAASIGRPVIAKTGTTQDNLDAWMVGSTPDVATAVWVGYAQPKAMSNVHGRSVTGGSFPAQIFAQVMRAAHKGIPVHPIHTASPDGLGLRMLDTGITTSTASTTTSTTLEVLVGDVTTTTRRRDRETTTTTERTTRTTRRPSTTTTTSTTQPTPTSKPKSAGATTSTTR
jgi:penicillin-binding protein 1A